jgi:hypothetical protein
MADEAEGDKKLTPATTKKAARQKDIAKGEAWAFPRHTLEEAIAVPKAIEEKMGGNPIPSDMLAKALGFNQPNDWRYLGLLRSANQYGLVSGSGEKATVSLTKTGQDVVAPSSPEQRQDALLKAFKNVDDFKKAEEFYRGKRIPEDEYFVNTLTRNFAIPRDRTERFSEVFRSNMWFLKSFAVPTETEANQAAPALAKLPARKEPGEPEQRIREFLDTCFVMMPFGQWFDRYYQEIYIPAIKDAGFEPVRADELFSSGSVVEQIWEQIEKAKVLLADLTDRNPNVFYELGLAHAAKKPVIFAAAHLEDIPFDLRHLRVIVYEVRAPNWAEKLRKSVTDFVRNAVKDPGKSIPHPFRGKLEHE